MKIAVVGTGIAGNVVARALAREHAITVYEADRYIGGHTNTVDVELHGRRYPIDTGFIVFNDWTYPAFIALLEELGVESQTSEMSFSVRCERAGFEYNGASLDALFAQRSNLLRPSFFRMIGDILRFNRTASRLLDGGCGDPTLGEFLASGRYSRRFIEHYIVPMGAAIWSAEPRRLLSMPAQFFVRFFSNHGLLNLRERPVWRVIKGGSRQYVERLVAGHRDRIRLSSPVRRIRRTPAGVELRTHNAEPEIFDQVFIACHSDQALALLDDASNLERAVLGAIPFQENTAVLHTDTSLLPQRRRAWAAWNYRLPVREQARVSLTYNMNILQGLDAPETFCVTLNGDEAIAREKVLRRMRYAHPVFTRASVAAQRRHGEVNGDDRIYYCGAYWGNGFHEDGVVSAHAALGHFHKRVQNAQLHLRRAG